MAQCNYLAPQTLDELLSVLHQHGGEARVIAGGTDLVPQMRLGKLSPRILIDPRYLQLYEITSAEDGLHVGASVTHTQALTSPLLQAQYPALPLACQQVGGPPVRNRGTLVGNLANASPAADSALPLLVYDTQVVTSQLCDQRKISLNDFYLGPGQTVLAVDEFIREICVPKMPPRTKAVFIKLGKRHAMAIAVASVAVRLSLDLQGRVIESRIALGSVAPKPLRAFQAEAILQSNPLDDLAIRMAAQSARQAADPISDVRASAEYRSKMVEVLTRRALHWLRSQFAQGVDHD